MFIQQVLVHTPTWVWLLLAYLVWRGVTALRPREVAPSRALIMPIVFLLWGLVGLIGSRGLGLDLASFAIGFASTFMAGRALAALTPPPRLVRENGMLEMPGSSIPLAMILIAFASKYFGAVAMATQDDPAIHAEIGVVMAVVGGGFAGLFWGRTLALFQRALRGAGESADYAAVARLALAGSRTRSDGVKS